MNENNIRVFEDTLRQAEKKYPVNFEDVRYYNDNIKGVPFKKPYAPIEMVRGGTVSTGYANADSGMRVAILNFADALTAGGLVLVGENTQEENICRCTNLYPVLSDARSYKAYYLPNRQNGDFVYTNRIIYARDITVFKDDSTYENIEPRQFDVITCPAPSENLPDEKAVIVYMSRIQAIILSAIENGVDCIVLGAWGCGAFGQNPELIAQTFANMLNMYGGYFKKIVFAIRSTPNTFERDSYSIFRDILEDKYDGGVEYEK